MNRRALSLLLLLSACSTPSTKGETGSSDGTDGADGADGTEAGATVTGASIVATTPQGDETTSPTSSDTLLCVAETDGDDLTLTYGWAVNGVDSPVNSAELSPPQFVRDDVVGCTVTGEDAAGTMSSATAETVVIGNSPPSVTVEIDPDPLLAGETDATCAFAVTDPDGAETIATETATWAIDGDPSADGLESDGMPSADRIFEGEELSCTVEATDTSGASASLTATVTVAAPAVRDGSGPATAALSCEDIETALGDPFNGDYWVHETGSTADAPTRVVCLFDLHEEAFAYSGSSETWTVPDGAHYVTVLAWGGAGGSVLNTACGGNVFEWGGAGGAVEAVVAVTPGDSLVVVAGAGGADGSDRPGAGQFNSTGLPGDGGPGAPLSTSCGAYGGASGGGYSGVFSGSVDFANALVVAAGGGGAGSHGEGGAGAGDGGQDGEAGGCRSGRSCSPGGGATVTAGGATGHTRTPRVCATNGTSTIGEGTGLYGGSGCWYGSSATTSTGAGGGGGGGGGYYGGGGGSGPLPEVGAGGGGGGSSYTDGSLSLSATFSGGAGTTAGGAAWPDRPADVAAPSASGDGGPGHVIVRY